MDRPWLVEARSVETSPGGRPVEFGVNARYESEGEAAAAVTRLSKRWDRVGMRNLEA